MTPSVPLTTRAVRLAGVITLLASCLGLVGCSHKYSADGATSDNAGATTELLAPGESGGIPSARALYPLAVGNRWDYRIRTRSEITTDAGPQPPVVEENSLAIEITGTQTIDGRDYFQQSESDPSQAPPNSSVFNLRGNRFGLFELDLVSAQQDLATDAAPLDDNVAALMAYVDRTVTDPSQRAAFQRAAAEVAAKIAAARPTLVGRPGRPGAVPGEITLLSYPLYPGARWIVRDDPRFARIVVGPERVNLPLGTLPAWKLRGTSELFGPEDRVHFWYSRLGLLRIRFHVVGDATDNTGNVIGRVVTDSDQSLTEIHLVRTGAALVAGDDARE